MNTPAPPTGIRIGLSAVVIGLRLGEAVVLTTRAEDGSAALPFGPFDPARDRTFELALRAFVTDQTGFRPGYVEQLYTFGDLGRDSPRATQGPERLREVSVGYLALTADAADTAAILRHDGDARWRPVLDFFPWEDHRQGRPAALTGLDDALKAWADGDARKQARVEALFAPGAHARWSDSRVLERYELLYEAGLVVEAARDADRPAPALPSGAPMASDHRRILATGLGRLRSKLRYRPVLFDLMPGTFTLSDLQRAAEATTGVTLHKQNFRRGVERTGLVRATGRFSTGTGGRPAELFTRSVSDPLDGQTLGLPLPVLR